MINNHMARPIEEHTEVCDTCKGEGEIKGEDGMVKCGDCDGKGEIWYRS